MTLFMKNIPMLTEILYTQIILLQNQVIEIHSLCIVSIVKIKVSQEHDTRYQTLIKEAIKADLKDVIWLQMTQCKTHEAKRSAIQKVKIIHPVTKIYMENLRLIKVCS